MKYFSDEFRDLILREDYTCFNNETKSWMKSDMLLRQEILDEGYFYEISKNEAKEILTKNYRFSKDEADELLKKED